MRIPLLSMALVVALAVPGSAQLILGTDDINGGTNAWHVDLTTGTATALWTGFEVWGLTADDANRTIYFNDGADLYSATYPGCSPTLLGTITDSSGASSTMVALAWANGKLYATKNVTNEGVYEIDLTTFVVTLVLDYGDGDYDFGGFDYNPADGLFYATNDDSTPHGAGVYSLDVFGGGTIAFVTAYPAGKTDIDGCGVGDNKVWLIEDEPAPLHNFDLVTMTYDPTPLTNPITTPEIFAGGGWAESLVVPGGVVTYCTAKMNSCGSMPAIGSIGSPSASSTSGFTVSCSNARASDSFNLKNGVLIYSVVGPGSTPFQGGTLCLKLGSPIRRTATKPPSSPGTPMSCDAMHTIDMNAFAQNLIPGQGTPDPALLIPCQQVWCQWIARDTKGNGPLVSDAITYVQLP